MKQFILCDFLCNISSFSSFIFGVKNKNSKVIQRLRVKVEDNLEIMYAYTALNPCYQNLINKHKMHEIQFSEGEKGEIVCYFVNHHLNSLKNKIEGKLS